MPTVIVTLPDGRRAKISGEDRGAIRAEISRLQKIGLGSSEFSGLSSEDRAELARGRLAPLPGEENELSALQSAGNIGLGALHAAGDIPAGLEQIVARGSRFAGLPEGVRAGSERRIGEYERLKAAALAQPGAEAGYLGGKIATALTPGGASGRLADYAKSTAIGMGLTAVSPYEDEALRAKAVLESAAFSAAVGTGIKATGIIGRRVKRAILGGEVIEATGQRASRAITARNRGYVLTLGETSGNKRIQALEDASENMLGGTALSKIRAGNKENTNRILSRRVGEETPEISSEWLAKTADDIFSEFDAVRALDLGGSAIDISRMAGRLKTVAETGKLTGGKKIGRVVGEFKKRYPRQMTWNEYADLRSEWAKSVIGSSFTDPDFGRRLGSLIGALDDAAVKAAPNAGSLKAATARYREFLAIKNSVDENGDLLSGKLIKEITRLRKGAFWRAKDGDDELVDVARTLGTFKNQTPSSGTAERLAAMKTIEAMKTLPGKITRLGLTGTGFALGDLTGAAAGYATPYIAQRVLMSDRLKKYLETEAPRMRELARTTAQKRTSQAIRAAAVIGGFGG